MSSNNTSILNTEIKNLDTKQWPFDNLVFLSIKNKGSQTIFYNVDGKGAVSLDPGEEDPFHLKGSSSMSGRIEFEYKGATNVFIKIRTIQRI